MDLRALMMAIVFDAQFMEDNGNWNVSWALFVQEPLVHLLPSCSDYFMAYLRKKVVRKVMY